MPAAAVGTAGSDAVIAALVADLAAALGVPPAWITVVVMQTPSRRGLAARQALGSAPVAWLAAVRPPTSGDAATAASVAALHAALASVAAGTAASFGASLADTFQTMADLAGVPMEGFSVTNIAAADGAVPTPSASAVAGATPGGSTPSTQATIIGSAVGGVLIAAALAAAAIVQMRRRAISAMRDAEAAAAEGDGYAAVSSRRDGGDMPCDSARDASE